MGTRIDLITKILSDYAHLSDFDKSVMLVQILKRVGDLDLGEINLEIWRRNEESCSQSVAI